MKRKDFIEKVLTVLIPPVSVLVGYAISGSGGFNHLWPFLLGYSVGAVYLLLLELKKIKQ